MISQLTELEVTGRSIKVGVIGAGLMGRGVAHQIVSTPGLELVFVADREQEVLDLTRETLSKQSSTVSSEVSFYEKGLEAISSSDGFDVLIEATPSILAAYDHALAAMERGAHVILMNAEVDLALGRLLQAKAREYGVCCSSDAGDQHGVLATMIEEIRLWGFEITQAGNIKGYLDRYATPDSLNEEASKRHLSVHQCCAYTDGTKLNIEMALLSNAYGFLPSERGMTGPPAAKVEEVMSLFDWKNQSECGSVDYILGAEPGGGVYVVGKQLDEFTQSYLSYYKMGEGPYYLFYRPYHLCHLETPRAIASIVLQNQEILKPLSDAVCEVYAFAKRDLKAGQELCEGGQAIGSSLVYGLIDTVEQGAEENLLSIWLLEEQEGLKPVLNCDIKKDERISLSNIEWRGLTEGQEPRLFELQKEQNQNSM